MTKLVTIEQTIFPDLLNDLRNFNEIVRKNATYDNIKSHKKWGFAFFPENTFLGKP